MCQGIAGLFLHGIAGIGKSVLAGEIADQIIAEHPGTRASTITGVLTVEQLVAIMVADGPSLVVLDQFDMNVANGAITDRGLAAVLVCLAEEITSRVGRRGHARLIVVAQEPLSLGPRILVRWVGPLSWHSTDELARSLPRLKKLTVAQRDYAWRLTAGHPGCLRAFDARLANATFNELADSLAGVIAARTGMQGATVFPAELDPAAAAAIVSAAGSVLNVPQAATAKAASTKTPTAKAPTAKAPSARAKTKAAAAIAKATLAAATAKATAAAAPAEATAAVPPDTTTAPPEATAAPPEATAAPLNATTAAPTATPSGATAPAGILALATHPEPGNDRRHARVRIVSAALVTVAIVSTPFVIRPLIAGTSSVAAADRASLPAGLGGPAAAQAQAERAQAPEAAAATWLASNVTPGTVIGCDPAMCASLSRQGLDQLNLSQLHPGADVSADGLIVATPQARALMGSAIQAAAPELSASFGTGSGQVQIWQVTPGGAAAYHSWSLAADMASRREAGNLMLGNSDVKAAGTTWMTLAAGQVDERIMLALAQMAHSGPLTIQAFGAANPGAAAAVPVRSVLIEVANPAAAAAALKVQDPAMQPLSVRTGPATLWVEYGAPSPLGLFQAES
jgi:hypothetical protein